MMRSFEPGFLEKQPVSHALLRTIRLIGEYKGKESVFQQQAPQILETLRQTAVIQSTEASNRIEGIEAPHVRIIELVQQKTKPQNRPEQEIAGYRDVLATIHANHANMPFTINLVLQLHRDLYRYAPQDGGRWKTSDNEITEFRPDGSKIIRFKPVPAYQTAEMMQQLHARFDEFWHNGEFEPLLLIPAYVLDFLCIHPFLDGNGRMARLLTLLLLYKAGYGVGRYISLEQIVDSQRQGYNDALLRSSRKWHQGKHSLAPWWEYFLGVILLTAYREFERRTGVVTSARGAKRDMILDTIEHLPTQFKISDIERTCPNVSRPTVNRVLRQLRLQGKLIPIKQGRDATWEKT